MKDYIDNIGVGLGIRKDYIDNIGVGQAQSSTLYIYSTL